MESFPPLPSNPPLPPLILNPLAPPFVPPNPSSQSSSWSKKFFSLNHIPEVQRLDYYPPVPKNDWMVAVCSKAEVDSNAITWNNAIQGFFAGKRPFLGSIIKAVENAWKSQGTMEIFPRPDDSVIFIFSSPEDRLKVLERGPWFLMGRYLHIRAWSRDARCRKDFFGSMPIWLRLPNLSLHFWSPGSIGRIASVVGKPLFLDDKSANASRLRFARVYVEVSASRPLPDKVFIEVEGEDGDSYEQVIEYETRIFMCSKCKAFGHRDEACEEANRCKPMLYFNRKSPSEGKLAGKVDGKSDGRATTIVKVISDKLEGEKENVEKEGGHPTNLESRTIQNGKKPLLDAEPGWKLVVRKKNSKKKILSRASGDAQDSIRFRSSEIGRKMVVAQKIVDHVVLEQPENSGRPFTADSLSNSPVILERDWGFKLPDVEPVLQGVDALIEVAGIERGDSRDFVEIQAQNPDFTPPVPREGGMIFAPGETDGLAFADVGLERVASPEKGGPSVSFVDPRPVPSSDREPSIITKASSLVQNQPQTIVGLSPTVPSPSIIDPIVHSSYVSLSTFPPNLSQRLGLEDTSEEEDFDSFPPGFTPSKEDMASLRELMKEGTTMIPPELQSEFINSVDCAEDGEILEFFQDKLKGTNLDTHDMNYLTFRNVRRSPRIKKKPAKFTETAGSSGLKKGFLK